MAKERGRDAKDAGTRLESDMRRYNEAKPAGALPAGDAQKRAEGDIVKTSLQQGDKLRKGRPPGQGQ